MNKFSSLALFCLPLLIAQVHADSDDDDNSCAYLSVMVSNATNQPCHLLSKNIKHGNMSSSTQVPSYIGAGNSGYPFEMVQTIFGPDIVLTYECGPERLVSFESQQNFCFIQGGFISGFVHRSENLSATYSQDRGSWFWGRHGAISWIIS